MVNCNINVSNEQSEFPVNESKLEKICCNMLEFAVTTPDIYSLSVLSHYDLSKISLNIDVLICDDERIWEINRQFRDINKPTDVLSFALFADNPETRLIINNEISLGEIIISAQTAKRQADENKKSFEEEVNFLLSHGILHLLGFDHKDEESLEFMLKNQEEMLLNI